MQPNEGRIRVFGLRGDSHRVQADVLARALSGLQESALIVAAFKEGQQLSERFRPSAELRQKYTIEVGPPEKGSVIFGFGLVDLRPQPTLEIDSSASDVLQTLYNTFRQVSLKSYVAIKALIPDSRWRDRLLRSLESFLPEPGADWQIGLTAADMPEVTVAGKDSTPLKEAIGASVISTSVMAVTGTLIRVDFESNQLWIKHPKTNKLIECNYVPEIEEELINARRDNVQVIGEFTLDDSGYPNRLSNVSSVRALNLTSLTFTEVSEPGLALNIQPQLALEPYLDPESTQLLMVEDESLSLHIFAYTREELIEEVKSYLLYMWKNFVLDEQYPLSDDAIELKSRLKQRLSEAPHA